MLCYLRHLVGQFGREFRAGGDCSGTGARNASNLDVKNRYVTIAQHYLTLAEAEERSADQKGVERRSRAAC
jgi:hypothetical protein